MATRFVTVQSRVLYGDGSIWPNAKFQFFLKNDGLSGTAILPQKRIEVYSSPAGLLTVQLWDNSEGLRGTEWHCKHPSGQCFLFTINAATPSPVELSVLETAGIGPSDPNYDTLFSALTGGAIVGQAPNIALNPVISIGGVNQSNVQGAIAAIAAGLPFLYTFSWGDATPQQIWLAPVNALVVTTRINILVPFDAPSLLSIGDSGDPNRLFPSSNIDPTEAVEWEYNPQHRYTTQTPVLFTIQQNGTSQGRGTISLEWRT